MIDHILEVKCCLGEIEQSFYKSIKTVLFSPFREHQISDTGTYTCVATSSSGETSWSAVLDVTGEFFVNYFNRRNLEPVLVISSLSDNKLKRKQDFKLIDCKN